MRDLDALVRFIDGDDALRALDSDVAKELGDDPAHDRFHARRVALWTLRLGGGAIDSREGVAAALLHDVRNVPKSSPERVRASELSAAYATEILASYRFHREAVARIAEAVRDHSYSRGAVPSTELGRALQDADRLEALGAIGILRTVSTGTSMGAGYFDPADPWAQSRPLDDRAFMIDHFFTKLLGLPKTFCTERGREEAQRRVAILQHLLEALAHELEEPLPDR